MTKTGSLGCSTVIGGHVCPGRMLGKLVVLVKCDSSPVLLAGWNVNTVTCRTQSELHHRSAAREKWKKKKESDHFRFWWRFVFFFVSFKDKRCYNSKVFLINSCVAECPRPPPPGSLSCLPNEAPSRHMGADVIKKNTPVTWLWWMLASLCIHCVI